MSETEVSKMPDTEELLGKENGLGDNGIENGIKTEPEVKPETETLTDNYVQTETGVDNKTTPVKEAKEEASELSSPSVSSRLKVTDESEEKETDESTPLSENKAEREHSPDPDRIGDPGGPLETNDIVRESRNRVKLYVLCEQRVWDDRGTGHVACVQTADHQAWVIIVRLEATDKNVLESRILMDTLYQKQQETLIVWSESETCDLALSFQEKNGCEEIWAKICEAQGRDPGEEGFDDIDEGELSEGCSSGRVQLPPIDMTRLSELEMLLASHLGSQAMREKIAHAIEADNYAMLPKLVDVFHMCEDISNTDGLNTLYAISKHMFMLNRASSIETLVKDKYLQDLVGMLEFDPAHKEPRKHREFLYERSKYKEVLPITNSVINSRCDEGVLREKIVHTYRVQYVHDVCLPAPSLFEENLLSTLSAYVSNCRADIVNLLLKDKRLMKDLFDQLRDPTTSVVRRRELALFLKEFIGLTTQPANNANKDNAWFKHAQSLDLLGIVEPCITSPDAQTRETISEILGIIVEMSTQTLREYLYKQSKDRPDEEKLLNRLLQHMVTDRDPELSSANHIAMVIRTLLDSDNMVQITKTERNDFVTLFYDHCYATMMKPLVENVSGPKLLRDDYCMANRQALIVRLACYFIEQHSGNMKQHLIHKNGLAQMLKLLQSKHHFLALSALKLLRTVVSVKCDFYGRYLAREKILDTAVSCLLKNGRRYNLLNSALLELFEYIKTEDLKPLVKYIVETHGEKLDKIKYVRVFADLRNRYEQQKDREERSGRDETRVASPQFSKEREEEQWFDKEDEEEEAVASSPKAAQRKSGQEPMFPSCLRRKNAIDEDDGPVFSGAIIPQSFTDKKITIKVTMGDRSRTPSPGAPTSPSRSPGAPNSPSREDEVSSSVANSKESSPSPAPSKGLVDYEGSDSDSEDDESNREDEVPSSSTGSPTGNATSADSIPDHSQSPPAVIEGKTATVAVSQHDDDDDVSSTSGEAETPPPSLSRKRSSTESADEVAKRSRTTETK